MKNSEHESICVIKRGDKEYWSEASGTWVKDTRLATTFHSTIAEIRATTLMRVTHVPCRAVEIISNKQYTENELNEAINK